MDLERLRYPIGRWQPPADCGPARVAAWRNEIAGFPARFRTVFEDLDDAQLDTRYRPDGWTVRQLAHHLADSHINGYVRFRLAATESTPTVRPYQEALWADLEDARRAEVEVSLSLLEALHDRWARLLAGYGKADWERRLLHPEIGELSVAAYLSSYAWHGRHHAAHVSSLRERMLW